jgi:hypothetical protein
MEGVASENISYTQGRRGLGKQVEEVLEIAGHSAPEPDPNPNTVPEKIPQEDFHLRIAYPAKESKA